MKRVRLGWFLAALAMGAMNVAGEDGWAFRIKAISDGPCVTRNGNVLSMGTDFVCVNPTWSEHYFYLVKHPFVKDETPGRISLSSDPAHPTLFFLDTLTVEALGDTRARILVHGRWTGDGEARIQHIPLIVPAPVLEGARVETDSGVYEIPGPGIFEMPEIPASRHFAIHGKDGDWTVTVKEGAPLKLNDRRKNPYRGRDSFLFQADALPLLKPGDGFSHQVEVEIQKGFDPLWKQLPAVATEQADPIRPLAPVAFEAPPRMGGPWFQPPREFIPGSESVTLPKVLTLAAPEAAGPDGLVRHLHEQIADAGGTRKTTVSQTASNAWITVSLVPAPAPDQYDFFEVSVSTNGAQIFAATPAAAQYGVFALAQWIGKGDTVVEGTIRDWSDFAWRGIHLLADDYSKPMASAMIRRLFGPLRINHLLLECEDVLWPGSPELHKPWGMPVEDVAALRELAVEYRIRIEPEVQTWGHVQYLFYNGANLDIAEDPALPYAYDVSNPRTYEVVGRLLEDVRHAFPDAGFLHIGHDEVNMRGTYPSRPANVGRPILELLAQDLKFYRDFAARKHLTLMMWHDMLAQEQRPERAQAFAAFPDKPDTNIVMAVWEYRPRKTFDEMEDLQGYGYRTIGCTGEEDLDNVIGYARYAAGRRAMGMLHTTWTGYGGNRRALFKYPQKLWPYVQAGVSFWNSSAPRQVPGTPGVASLAFDRVVRDLHPERYLLDGSERLVPLDLSPAANVLLKEDQGGFGAGDLRLPGGMLFHLAGGEGGAAVVLAADAGAPVSIPVERQVKAVSLLWAGLNPDAAALEEVGDLLIETESGVRTLPLAMGREIGSLLPTHRTITGVDTGRPLRAADAPLFWPMARPVFPAAGRFVLWQADLNVGSEMIRSISIRVRPGRQLVLAGATLVE